MIKIPIDTNTLKGYDTILKCKSLPKYYIENNTVITDKHSYNYVFGGESENTLRTNNKVSFDYQMYIVNKAVESKKFAIIGGEGINDLVPDDFWNAEKDLVLKYFKEGKPSEGLQLGITEVGEKLKEFFPYKSDDTNELSDEISKGF